MAIRVNLTKSGKFQLRKNHKNQNCPNKTACDSSQVKYYKYQKMSYFVAKCLELSKNQILASITSLLIAGASIQNILLELD